MAAYVKDSVVYGGPILDVPAHMSFGKYIIEKLKQLCCNGDRDCLLNGITGQRATCKDLLENIIKLATGLKGMNVKRGDVIAIWSTNGAEFLTALIGTLCAGATVTAFSVLYTRDEVAHALSISQPKIIIGSRDLLKRAMDIFNFSKDVVKIIQLDGTTLASDVISFQDVMGDSDIWNYEPAEVDGESDLALISYSSGTTGLPKGVMLTHLNVLYGVTVISDTGNSDNDKVLTVLPWSHVYGLLTTIENIINNKTIVYLPEYKIDIFLKTIEEFKINKIIAVPFIIINLAKAKNTGKYDLSSVNTVWSAAAPLTPETAAAAMKCLPNCKGIFQGFGMTETVVTVIRQSENSSASRKPGCCGYPLPGISAKVLHIHTHEKLGNNQHGEVCIRGPTVMKGYLNNEAATREVIDEEGYLKTGDIGYYDADGCFFIVDRLKELIKYKGYQVAPASIEKVLLEHNGVAECAIIGAPDELAGELPTAFVVPKDDYNVTEEELLHFTNERLSPIARLRGGVIFVNKIPRNILGKILRKNLKRRLNLERTRDDDEEEELKAPRTMQTVKL